MKVNSLFTALFLLISCNALADCFEKEYKEIQMTVCTINASREVPIMLFKDSEGKPYKNVFGALKNSKENISFLMNAGMYHSDLSPVGLYIEKGVLLQKISKNEGPGNFHLMPNGVFYIHRNEDESYSYHIKTTIDYIKENPSPYFATQSGPMLVINDTIHPKFIKGSDSRFVRNGVGVSATSEVYFVKSKAPINFYDFATFFKDELKTPNALYFDGKISTLYAPPFKTESTWFSVGPMVGAAIK
ncbi:phosphodiester glycosidase family protein [Thorsellia kenyensis]|uniref:Phosphodiester glycosidase family protein n=1 Tax=Thorsellia kenyensis TaxID=1549888 RepID=A0ABV6CB55_9GAMM